MKQKIYKVLQDGIGLIYPPCCPLCHQILRERNVLICRDCRASLHPIPEPRCKLCGRPVLPEEEYCPDCAKGRSFREGRGIFLYDARMKRSILLYKYGGRREYGTFFARALCVYGEKDLRRWRPDLIVPVPMHPKKKRQRGFNQAEDLAVRTGAYFHIPVACDLVKKVQKTKAQKHLDAAGRKRNLSGAFVIQKAIPGLRVLVIDDVFTTGSTIETLADCLRSAGAADIFFLTVAIGVRLG